MASGVFILCACCALKLVNDDESACRDYHGHDHAPLQVPAGTAITQGPHEWAGSLELTCHGHENGTIQPLGEYWVAPARSRTGRRRSAMSSRTPVPDALFDADLCQPLGREDWVDRFDWVIIDRRVVHAPVTWTWTCPTCGESGVMPDGPDLLAVPHGSQHAAGLFGTIVPLDVEAERPFTE